MILLSFHIPDILHLELCELFWYDQLEASSWWMFWDKCCTWRNYLSNEQIAYVAQGSVDKGIDFNKVHNPIAGFHTHLGDSFVYNCPINLAFDSTQLPSRGQMTWSLFSSPMVRGRAKISLGMQEEDGFEENWYPMCLCAYVSYIVEKFLSKILILCAFEEFLVLYGRLIIWLWLTNQLTIKLSAGLRAHPSDILLHNKDCFLLKI